MGASTSRGSTFGADPYSIRSAVARQNVKTIDEN
jgi:hypothetical protein